jgi:hypothetical protein
VGIDDRVMVPIVVPMLVPGHRDAGVRDSLFLGHFRICCHAGARP